MTKIDIMHSKNKYETTTDIYGYIVYNLQSYSTFALAG